MKPTRTERRTPLLPAALLLLLAFTRETRSAEPDPPAVGPDRDRITVTCGKVTLLLRRASQWTPGRIDFRGQPMTTERSAYGTVFSFPGIGFIGTGHLENEPEDLQSVEFRIDGSLLEVPDAELAGDTFRFERESRIRAFRLHNVIELKDDRLHEITTVSTDEAVPLKLVYHFMHAWVPTASAFLAGRDEAPGEFLSGELLDTEEEARKFHIEAPVDWVALYDPASGQFAVSRLLSAPEAARPFSRIWNVPGTYRKYYLQNFSNDTVPAGFEGTWSMVTAFGVAPERDWEAGAIELAGKLRE